HDPRVPGSSPVSGYLLSRESASPSPSVPPLLIYLPNSNLLLFLSLQSIASADMDFNQLEAFLTAQTKKQGGITSDQAAVISKFWKSHKTKIRESLMNQSRWDSGLRGLSWRVDGKSQSRHSAQIHTPVAIMELEIGKSGQVISFCKLYLSLHALAIYSD
uniref:COMM domain-containing protein 1 n=1 Tax=Ursus americanus TaxID=9643 RepID=A0A452RXT6_URSAM